MNSAPNQTAVDQLIQCPPLTLDREPGNWRVYEIDVDDDTFTVERAGKSIVEGGYHAMDAAKAWYWLDFYDFDNQAVVAMIPPGTEPLTFAPVAHVSRWSLWLLVDGQPLPLGFYNRYHVKTIAKAIVDAGGLPIIACPYFPSYGDWDDEAEVSR